MAPERTLAYIIAIYLVKCNLDSNLTYALAKDWHQYMDMSIKWRYTLRGVATELVQIQAGVIPEELL
ncbi:hypothetical protein Erwinia_phage_Pastis_00109 [Erwinia phage Pastis]|nr:hypothetical protein Erwinia_phage_Pastis_00109 [Erwinia phage Pastis]